MNGLVNRPVNIAILEGFNGMVAFTVNGSNFGFSTTNDRSSC